MHVQNPNLTAKPRGLVKEVREARRKEVREARRALLVTDSPSLSRAGELQQTDGIDSTPQVLNSVASVMEAVVPSSS